MGALPSVLLLLGVTVRIVRTVKWMWTTGSAFHPGIPLAMVIVAGFANAAFEDWMFAAGNYLCVFFWSLVFILVDVAPVLVSADTWESRQKQLFTAVVPSAQ